MLDNALLSTTQGVSDPNNAATANRIGDEINLKGIKCSIMVELNERYSDVTFRLMVVKSAKGDVPTFTTLFNGLSGNKMMDTLNTERYTIMYQKYFKLKAAGYGTIGGDIGTVPIGVAPAGTSN